MELPPFSAGSSVQAQPRVAAKKRRIPNACDGCKRRKIRCDSAEKPGKQCSNCVHLSLECTHSEVGKTLGSARRYVESLEARLDNMDRLLSKLLPGVDINVELAKFEKEEADLTNTEDAQPLQRNDDVASQLASELSNMRLLNPLRDRYFGKSSNLYTLRTAMELKMAKTGRAQASLNPEDWQRAKYWEIPEWATSESPHDLTTSEYDYPEEDLMTALIDLYFTQLNPHLPILHRPIFERSIKQNLHLRDSRFGATVLLVCAHGAKYSDDSRVLVDDSDDLASAGWHWYKQVKHLGHQLPEKASLYDVQCYILICLFGMFSQAPENAIVQAGLGLQLAVDVGAHTKSKDQIPTAETELWKRAFWCLYFLNTRYSAGYGRCPAIRHEDFDVEYPTECDDEFWEQGFRQPRGKPSRLTYFTSLIKVTAILNQALQALFSIRKPQNPLVKALRSEQECLVHLDSSMKEWLASLPSHLRRGSATEDDMFKSQSTYLHISYYHSLLVMHRPFIPSPKNPIPGSLPSLTICADAGRSCCSLLVESLNARHDKRIAVVAADTVFTVGITLTLCLLSQPSKSPGEGAGSETEVIHRCSTLLGELEERIYLAGRLKDILDNLYDNQLEGIETRRPQSKRSRDHTPLLPPRSQEVVTEIIQASEASLPGPSSIPPALSTFTTPSLGQSWSLSPTADFFGPLAIPDALHGDDNQFTGSEQADMPEPLSSDWNAFWTFDFQDTLLNPLPIQSISAEGPDFLHIPDFGTQ